MLLHRNMRLERGNPPELGHPLVDLLPGQVLEAIDAELLTREGA